MLIRTVNNQGEREIRPSRFHLESEKKTIKDELLKLNPQFKLTPEVDEKIYDIVMFSSSYFELKELALMDRVESSYNKIVTIQNQIKKAKSPEKVKTISVKTASKHICLLKEGVLFCKQGSEAISAYYVEAKRQSIAIQSPIENLEEIENYFSQMQQNFMAWLNVLESKLETKDEDKKVENFSSFFARNRLSRVEEERRISLIEADSDSNPKIESFLPVT